MLRCVNFIRCPRAFRQMLKSVDRSAVRPCKVGGRGMMWTCLSHVMLNSLRLADDRVKDNLCLL